MKEFFEHEAKKLRTSWKAHVLGFFLMVVLPYTHFYFLDGNVYNRVLTFNDPVNPLALRTDKDQYCPGEEIKIEQSFCKNREVVGYESFWWISNGTLVEIESRSETNPELPRGCYPEDKEGVTLVSAHTIPLDTKAGFHSSVGLTNHFLSGNRLRKQEYKIIPYEVLPASECLN